MATTYESAQGSVMKIATIYSVPPESLGVRTLYEVFGWGREAMAEYLYHGAELTVPGSLIAAAIDRLKHREGLNVAWMIDRPH